MAAEVISLSLNQDDLKKLLKRFDNAPDKIQRQATGVALTAGAKVVQKLARSKAPACLKSTIKLANRKTYKKYIKKVSVTAGGGHSQVKENLSPKAARIVRKTGSELIDCYPAMWVEFGTYGNRDYKGKEPYAPATLRKKSYASGRSNSPYWNYRSKWTAARPFMRTSIDDPRVEQAIAKKLDQYLSKKGL